MLKQTQNRPWLMLSIGAGLGLLVGVGMLVGAVTALQFSRTQQLAFPETVLNATATHGAGTMAVATGPIDSGTEGLFVLDFVTGELQCSVINPRTGQLGGLYKHNVVADLGVEQGKQPKYLMVTGAANFRTQGGNVRPAQSIVYIADSNTGRFAAYALPWNRQASSYNFAQVNRMLLLGKGSVRNLDIE